MSSSQINTIFSMPPRSRTRPGFFMVSMLAHGLILGFAIFAIDNAPRIDDQFTRRYTTKLVKLQGVEPRLHWSPSGGAGHSTPQPQMHAAHSGGQRAAAAAPKFLAYKSSAPVTLVQPDIAQVPLPQLKTAVPVVVMWTPPEKPVDKIVPRPPQPKVMANVRPSLAMPNHEIQVSSLELSSTSFVSASIPIQASTTSPIVVPGVQVPRVPATASRSSAQPTPATVLSVSDVIPTQGVVALPPANQTAAATGADSFMPGRPDSSSETGNGTNPGKQDGTGTGAVSGDQSGDGDQSAAGSGPAGGNGNATGSSSGSDAGVSSGDGPSVARITRPRDGHFSVVVVGDAVADDYPEAVGIWADRLAYTVYLHVGEERNWILQYCLPRIHQASASSNRPDAPWPYVIVAPHLAPGDADSDALLVHGFIDTDGRFEKLAVVYPVQFPQAQFVLSALQQWQFRPAAQDGKSTPVEVLLIIPEETE
ncbi:MAG TPA: hypothetical protein VMF56_10980 [Acidobacteriaceae bacterium]|nr:hypothetical protein [Acidobacteriaceae bacterium]